MSRRIDPTWRVLLSLENPQADRCVDIFCRPDGSAGFEEFRRDPEDLGAWTPITSHASLRYPTPAAARADAARLIPWLTPSD